MGTDREAFLRFQRFLRLEGSKKGAVYSGRRRQRDDEEEEEEDGGGDGRGSAGPPPSWDGVYTSSRQSYGSPRPRPRAAPTVPYF